VSEAGFYINNKRDLDDGGGERYLVNTVAREMLHTRQGTGFGSGGQPGPMEKKGNEMRFCWVRGYILYMMI
jgi:hypothetical protein